MSKSGDRFARRTHMRLRPLIRFKSPTAACALVLYALGASLACTTDSELLPTTDETTNAVLTAAQRRAHAVAIRDVSAREGLTNAALLGGIAISETQLTHCWRDATWACKGPASASCGGGPVIAGAGDGPCSHKQGGLGMFQFDGGTFAQTLARDGAEILQLEGNIAHAVTFATEMVMGDVPGITTRADALAWMNSATLAVGDAKMEQWASTTACRYNGCCSKTSTLCRTRRNKYRDNAIAIYKEFGAAFWKHTPSSPEPEPDPLTCGYVPEEGMVIDQRGPCYKAVGQAEHWRSDDSSGAVGGTAEWTYGTAAATPSNYAIWQIRVPAPGRYRVAVNLDGGGIGRTTKARYEVRAGGSTHAVTLNQRAQRGMIELGIFQFDGTEDEGVMLGDNTGDEMQYAVRVMFDAIEVSPEHKSTPLAGEISTGCSTTGRGGSFALPLLAFLANAHRRRRTSLRAIR